MAPVKVKVFTCQEKTCCKSFTNRSNRDRHEKRFHYKAVKRRNKQPFFGEVEKNCIEKHLDAL